MSFLMDPAGLRLLTCWELNEQNSGIFGIRNCRKSTDLSGGIVREHAVVVDLYFALAW